MHEFFKWLFKNQEKNTDRRLSSRKEKQFQEMKKIWEESSKVDFPKVPDINMEWTNLQRKIKIAETDGKKQSWNLLWIFTNKPQFVLAISIIVLAVLIVVNSNEQNQGLLVYESANKEKKSIVLADGSTVQLNSGSWLSVPDDFNENFRIISLEGEGYFEVQKSQIPFQVQTKIGKITVLGTKFNINSRDLLMEVAVNEGIVKVTQNDSSIVLKEGQLSLCESGKYPSVPQETGFEEYPGWLFNKLTLQERELSFVIEEIERRFDVKIIQNDKKLNQLIISGLFDASDLDSLVSALCLLIQKEYRIENKNIIIY